jgi:mercuric ion binding protein
MRVLILFFMLFSMNAMAEEVRVKVSGMVCSLCAQGIQKKFSSEGSVQSLKVNMDDKLVTIQTKDGESISDDRIKSLITEAGYNVAEITRQ